MFLNFLLFCSIAGLISCTVFVILLAAACLRFHRIRAKSRPDPDSQFPWVSLLKPLHGEEPDLERNLESFFVQDYPAYEIIFGCRQAADPALLALNAVQQRHPEISVKVVLSGEPDRPNAKVCSLEKMMAAASSNYLVISDSDVRVTSDYIREIIRPLLQPRVGLVTCLYRGVSTGGLWPLLEALGMSVEMTSGVVVAEMLEGMKFALGPSMAVRRDALEAIGGFGVLANYCADDFILGMKIHEAGFQVVLSHHVIEHIVVHGRFSDSILHQVRWMKSTRFSRPLGHLGSGLTFATPFGILGMVAGMVRGQTEFGFALLGWAIFSRVVQALIAGWGIVEDPRSVKFCWLYPVRDLMGFLFWCASFLSPTIVWRGERYRLQRGGTMVLDTGEPVSSKPVQGRLL